ncbi:Fe-S protein assembly co-chaperone HscB [Cyphellophora europaea CBS 101466]|uniref:Fe-S protein assembly co-chaperone HscB n=1 Tax=Cyphellophora europaea (strain CBS 101466) TaxID=1220924 RepID=W2S9V5_CYPE1|nr:Fe-S protein assembly co-chaperone HscB [Cyphellophora europaea CBS 101466]ETN44704.1 Fe-S protein assembly co-chaperone HscB [Cyphellophora europaea CBS 101466]
MKRAIPSRQALRHLARLCNEPIRSARAPLCTVSRQTHPAAQLRSTPPQPSRTLSTSAPSRQEPPTTTTTTTSSANETTNIAPPPLPDTTSYYTLFPSTLPQGPPPSGPFAIPLPALRREYLSLQSTHHPDKFPASSPLHKQSLGLSALLNTAYKTLSSPLLRAQYLLLHRHDIDVSSEDNSQNITDQGTLMEVMEAQEAVEEAANEDEIAALKEENNERVWATVQKMGDAFEREDVEEAKKECLRLKYWESLGQVLHDWEPGKEVRLVH